MEEIEMLEKMGLVLTDEDKKIIRLAIEVIGIDAIVALARYETSQIDFTECASLLAGMDNVEP